MTEPVDAGTNAPLCPTCGYSLLGLTEYRCPECGEAFDAEYVEDASFRANLLPWERPETGAVLRRLGRTLVQAAFHPDRFFASVNLRKDRLIAQPGRLIAAFLLLSACFFGVAVFVDHAAFFLRLVAKYNRPAQAFESTTRLARILWYVDVEWSLMLMAGPILSVIVIAALIRWTFRSRIGTLRWIDLVAVFSPAFAIGALIAACFRPVFVASFLTIPVVSFGMTWASTAVVLLLLWFACRRLLLLSRWVSAGMLLIGWSVTYGSNIAAFTLGRTAMLW